MKLEYGLIVALIATAIIVSLTNVGDALSASFSEIAAVNAEITAHNGAPATDQSKP